MTTARYALARWASLGDYGNTVDLIVQWRDTFTDKGWFTVWAIGSISGPNYRLYKTSLISPTSWRIVPLVPL